MKQFTSVLEWFRMSCSEWKQWLTVYNYSWWNLRKYSLEGWKDLFLDNRFGFHFCGSCEFTFYIGTPGINEKFWVVWERMLIIYRTSGFSIFFFHFFRNPGWHPLLPNILKSLKWQNNQNQTWVCIPTNNFQCHNRSL